jgi:YidC/Oxa1 family membrane protein insertase
MFASIFGAIFYNPLYNFLILLIGIVPGGDVGLAVILLTLAVKIVLFPVILRGMRTQAMLRAIDPKIKALKEQFPKKRDEQAKATLALYKEYKINPFSALLPLLIQTPFLLALFFIFAKGGLPVIRLEVLYPFLHAPETISMHLFGYFNVGAKSLVLAIIAGGTQFLYGVFSLPKLEARKENASFSDDFGRSFQMNMRYILPAIIAVFAYNLPAAVAIYWITGNLFGTLQELYVRSEFKKKPPIT